MNFEKYVSLAMRTAKDLGSVESNLEHAYLGMVTELGEILDWYKRGVIYGKGLDIANLREELGDCFWYVALAAHTLNQVKETQTALDRMESAKGEVWASSVLVYDTMTAISVVSSDAARKQPVVNVLLLSYLLNMIAYSECSLESIFETNIAKLQVRYGDKYTDYKALNRNLGAERATLE
jgi:NTP pyrophosphatase (non-canonical NTP hydrolase)